MTSFYVVFDRDRFARVTVEEWGSSIGPFDTERDAQAEADRANELLLQLAQQATRRAA